METVCMNKLSCVHLKTLHSKKNVCSKMSPLKLLFNLWHYFKNICPHINATRENMELKMLALKQRMKIDLIHKNYSKIFRDFIVRFLFLKLFFD